MPGIFITKGMTIVLPAFSVRLGKDGSIENDPIALHIRFDVCPTWIDVARRHLSEALKARTTRESIWNGNDEKAKAKCLEAEFEASMQAIVAAATAWDAVYSVVQQHVQIPASLIERWRKGRTSRYSQVAEVVRRAFGLKEEGVRVLRSNLKEIYRFRDLAIHPSGKVEAAIVHPELKLGVEWRFVYFRASNAELAVSAAAAMLWQIANNCTGRNAEIAAYHKALSSRLAEVFPSGQPAVPTSRMTK